MKERNSRRKWVLPCDSLPSTPFPCCVYILMLQLLRSIFNQVDLTWRVLGEAGVKLDNVFKSHIVSSTDNNRRTAHRPRHPLRARWCCQRARVPEIGSASSTRARQEETRTGMSRGRQSAVPACRTRGRPCLCCLQHAGCVPGSRQWWPANWHQADGLRASRDRWGIPRRKGIGLSRQPH